MSSLGSIPSNFTRPIIASFARWQASPRYFNANLLFGSISSNFVRSIIASKYRPVR
ncbi:hypothetical protein C2G38_2129258 [Gigaspora rosea]|uniref:Uncharacterized protein n=1 Tax=Gigaspora rosea TaxID=44941 RepID=A0A397TV10_9GLOM|nr:hypothetical protein C2G38_2129258 [Gigaspora rosea]